MAIPVSEAREKKAHGCLIINTASEFGQRHPEFNEDTQQALGVVNRLFEQAVLRGQDEGSISRSADPAILGCYLSASLGTLRTLAKVGTPPQAIQALMPSFLKALD